VFFNVSLDHFIPALLTFVVLGFVSSVSAAKRLAGKTSLKWTILCRLGRKTSTQSINQSTDRTFKEYTVGGVWNFSL